MGREFTSQRERRERHEITGEFIRLDILSYIRAFINLYGYSPSFREIGAACDLHSTSSVAHHLSVLRARGKIEYVDNIARSVRIPS